MPRKTALPPAPEGPESTLLAESDESLMEAAKAVFEGMIESVGEVEETEVEVLEEPAHLTDEENAAAPAMKTEVVEMEDGELSVIATPGTPRSKDFVTVRGGGLYLPARRRIAWMRGEVVPHPDWTIDTYPEEVEKGDYKAGKVSGGYARYRAAIFDDTGRLVATGTKTEYSERFTDYVEKAETGAIARALAVAGYGTEAALDLDEGYEDDRLADAPVGGRPIEISASDVPGLRMGGRSENITAAQLNEIAARARQLQMGLTLVPFIEGVLEVKLPDLPAGDAEATQALLTFLQGLSFDDASRLILALSKAQA